jgi:hypothetical protein
MDKVAHDAWTFLKRTVARIHDRLHCLRDALMDARETRNRLEASLFHNQYRLSSKNDDDLPVVH